MSGYAQRMIDVVGDLDFTDDPVDEFAGGAFALLVLALRKLSPDKREELLEDIESGALRRSAGQFSDMHPQNQRRH